MTAKRGKKKHLGNARREKRVRNTRRPKRDPRAGEELDPDSLLPDKKQREGSTPRYLTRNTTIHVQDRKKKKKGKKIRKKI